MGSKCNMMDKELQKAKNLVIQKLNKYLKQSKIKDVVIGISGGIDSAIGLNILNEAITDKKRIHAFFIDIESNKQDYIDACKIANTINIKLEYISLNKSYKALKKEIKQFNTKALANIKSRLRMVFLYDQAYKFNAIVCSNSNLDELYIGYFTKYGDNACDVFLLNNFTKSDIYALAKYYNVPHQIIIKQPSAGLYEGQTDEKEIGLSYKVIDNYLQNKSVNKDNIKKIEELHSKNYHKLSYNYDINSFKKNKSLWKKQKTK